MENQNILISGASVAGPALAYWLRRRGFNPTVVEQAPSLRGGGYAVDFRGAAHLSVLAKMGLLDQIRDQQTHLDTTTYVDSGGRRVASMPAGIFAGDVEILRGDLGRILYQATRDGTEYLFDDTITGLDQRADGVHVTFSRADPRVFDLVIGADGLHSAVRRLAFGDAAGRGTISACTCRSSAWPTPSAWTMPGCCTACRAGRRPSSAPGTPDGPWPSSSSPGRRPATTTVTAPGSRRSWPTPSPRWAGRSPSCWPRWPRRTTFTSTRSARCGWTGGRPGGWP
ncbi:MAG: FAD-dependent monooxygenase [Streptosporangiaceae bacterium]